MDRKTILAFVLIGILIFVMQIINKPTPAEMEKQKQEQLAKQSQVEKGETATSPSIEGLEKTAPSPVTSDAVFEKFAQDKDAKGTSKTIENEKLKLTFNSKGGRLEQVELKDYLTAEKEPLLLMNDPRDVFSYQFYLNDAGFSSQDFNFDLVKSDANSIVYRLSPEPGKYIEQEYRFSDEDFSVDYDLRVVGMQDQITSGEILLDWQGNMQLQEHDLKNERAQTSLYYRDLEGDVDKIKLMGGAEKDLDMKVEWVGMKQQFFNQTLIPKDKDMKIGKAASKELTADTGKDLELLTAKLYIPYDKSAEFEYPMQFYLGPNHYQTLKKKGIGLEKSVYLGYSIIRWVNLGFIIPIFNFLNKYISNYGIIILLLTLFVKTLLFPLTFRSYKSMAKMSVLKPELEGIKAKFPDDAQRQQQETMKLYQKSGVNPLGGCLPQLLQMPILIAMYYFFPTSIELRQESFLWANDLSTYDSIMSLPFNIPMYGSHVSLFALLSGFASLAYTKLNSQMQRASNPQMKYIQYIMPFFLIVFFNRFAAGLTYYFFLSNIITFGQQFAIKKFFINEDEIRKDLKKNARKPKKQSKFAKKLQEMVEEQQKKQQEMQANGGKGSTASKPKTRRSRKK